MIELAWYFGLMFVAGVVLGAVSAIVRIPIERG